MVLVKTFLVPVIFIIIGLLHPLINKFEPETYDGWSLDEEKIILSKNTLTGHLKKEVLFSDITQLQYFSGSRRADPKIIFIIEKTKIWLTLNYDSFKMAQTLKFFINKGLKVSLLKSDAELQMYLDNIIDNIPMTNKY